MSTVTLITAGEDRKAALAEHIKAIRGLGKRAIADIVEIGQRLTKCKKLVEHGNWGNWLEREFGWAERTAQRFMQVAEVFGSNPSGLTDLVLPAEGLYLLTAPSTPETAREEIIERAKTGEKIKHAEIKETIAKARPASKPRHLGQPTPAQKAAEVAVAQRVSLVDRTKEAAPPLTQVQRIRDKELPPLTSQEITRMHVRAEAGRLIDALVHTHPDVREKAVELVLGKRHAELERFSQAVRELAAALDRGSDARRSSFLRVIDGDPEAERPKT